MAAAGIFDSRAEALVNPVNCRGVMGKGLALAFKERFPANFQAYKTACSRGKVFPGHMLVFPFLVAETTGPRFIINFPTKRDWRDASRQEDIESGLLDLVRQVRAHAIRSVAVPALGCGLGGLPWETVRPLILEAFEGVPEVELHLYGPDGARWSDTVVPRTR